MEMNKPNDGGRVDSVGRTLVNGCVAGCQKVLAQVTAVKARIFEESRATLRTQERVLRLALNEAEAVAWQTLYPHLVFPTLAMEKVQTVAAWNERQQLIRRSHPVLPMTAG